MIRKLCVISGRQLGDTVIQATFVKQLVELGVVWEVLVWTRPQYVILFREIPRCRTITSQFPVGSKKNFGVRACFQFLKAILRIRAHRPFDSIDFIGDFREQCFARMVGSEKHIYIKWSESHPFRNIIRVPFQLGEPIVCITQSVPNIYGAYETFVSQLKTLTESNGEHATRSLPSSSTKNRRSARTKLIGIHPLASQRCKMWPVEYWRILIAKLLDKKFQVKCFAAPNEVDSLKHLLGGLVSRVEISASNLHDCRCQILNLEMLIGLDSFAVHMAESVGTKSLVINACNHPTLWKPPHALQVSDSGGCIHHPCMNVPRCIGTDEEYICQKAITPGKVFSAVLDTIGFGE